MKFSTQILLPFVLCFLILMPKSLTANESPQIAGMGGAFVGLRSIAGGIFGNPAGLLDIEANNLSLAISTRDLNYESITLAENEQLSSKFSLRLRPFIYYSRIIKGVGVSLGYIDDVDSYSTIKVTDTVAGYIVDERKFVSDTDTILEYGFARRREAILSLGYPIKPNVTIGAKLKYKHRIFKEGTIYRPLHLEAVHAEDVNRNDPAKLLPAVIDNLDIGNAIDRFKSGEDSYEDVVADLSGGGIDFDLGLQADIPYPGNITAGLVLENLLQHRIAGSQPAGIRFGVGAMPKNWLIAAIDFQKSLDKSGLNMNLGVEIHYKWERWFSGGIMLRSGFAYESPEGLSAYQVKRKASIGIGLILGESHWDYTLVKPFDNEPIRKATHIFSSNVRF